MTHSAQTASATASPSSGFFGTLHRAEDWLDAKGRGAWIGAMVLGYVFFWPVGLALTFYITLTNRWGRSNFASVGSCSQRRSAAQDFGRYRSVSQSTGNRTFDAYKSETLKRLEQEQEAFENFLERLRAAKDKSEFDSFMDDRARAAKTASGDADASAQGAGPVPALGNEAARTGEY